MSELTAAQTDKLLADLRLVVADAEELLHTTAGQAGEGVAELRAKVQASRGSTLPAITADEWQSTRAEKLAQQKALQARQPQ